MEHRQETGRGHISNEPTLPVAYTFTPAEVEAAHDRAAFVGTPASRIAYQCYDDGIAIYLRRPELDYLAIGERLYWDFVGNLRLAADWPTPGVVQLFAIEIGEGFTRDDVERHIALLFLTDERIDDDGAHADDAGAFAPVRLPSRLWSGTARRLGPRDGGR